MKGAFTGADSSHDGLIKQADQGTLFLDEIGELPKTLQKKLLRVLQERRFRPVGSKAEVKSNFRLISATNKDLEAMVESENFRQDLLFRLRTFVIELPPIRGRHKDIKDLALHYTKKICRDYHFDKKELSGDFLDTLFTYKWPGNVREFISSMESAVAMGSHSRTLFSKHLPNYIRMQALGSPSRECDQEKKITCIPSQKMVTLKNYRHAALAQAEKEYLESLMKNTIWNVKTACRTSGLRRARLYQLLKKYNIKKST